MAEEQSQEELLAQQKANCIFCKIVSGEMQSKVVYEDELMEAILDIRPAVKGHSLLLLKEHYPIMPLIPPEEFAHLFGTTAQISAALREGMLAQRCTTFIANGAIAGQQSPHFLFHLIPREDGDGLENFAIPKGNVAQQEIIPLLKQNLAAVMQQHLQKTGKTDLLAPKSAPPKAPDQEPASPVPQRPPGGYNIAPGVPDEVVTKFAEEEGARKRAVQEARESVPLTPQQVNISPEKFGQLARIIEQTPELKALLINNPAKLKEIIEQNPQFKELFAGIDIEQLGAQIAAQFHGMNTAPTPPQDALEPVATPSPASQPDDVKPAGQPEDIKPAAEMTMRELFDFVESKPKLKELMLNDTTALLEMITQNQRLAKFFDGSNVDAIIQAYREQVKAEVQVEKDIAAFQAQASPASLPSETRDEQSSHENAVETIQPETEEREVADAEVEIAEEPPPLDKGEKPDLDKISRLFQ